MSCKECEIKPVKSCFCCDCGVNHVEIMIITYAVVMEIVLHVDDTTGRPMN